MVSDRRARQDDAPCTQPNIVPYRDGGAANWGIRRDLVEVTVIDIGHIANSCVVADCDLCRCAYVNAVIHVCVAPDRECGVLMNGDTRTKTKCAERTARTDSECSRVADVWPATGEARNVRVRDVSPPQVGSVRDMNLSLLAKVLRMLVIGRAPQSSFAPIAQDRTADVLLYAADLACRTDGWPQAHRGDHCPRESGWPE
jgi:hypothetical protein